MNSDTADNNNSDETNIAKQNPETTPDVDNNRSQTQKRPPTKKSRSDSPSPTRSIEEQLEPIRNKIEANPERYILSYEELKDFLENTFGNNEPLSVAREYTDDISALLNMMYDLYTLISNQLPPPFILAGDFNSHNTLWGSTKDDRRGKQIENIIDNNATLLNDGSPTHLCTGSGNFSFIDITLCHPRLTPNITWETIPYIHGSDHFPIKLSLTSPNIGTAQHQYPRWNLKNANWELFKQLVKNNTKDISDADNINTIVDDITKNTITAAEKSIGYINSTKIHKTVPWWQCI
ncbi:hypothetical protein CBL_20354 [Carabus blaptoides fortunei]